MSTELRSREPVSTPHEDGSRRQGRVVLAGDTGAALRLAGLRDCIHPNDACAVIYPSLAYFNESAARDRSVHGNEVYGPYATAAGMMGIVDMRGQLSPESSPWPPALPDESRERTSGAKRIRRDPGPSLR